MYSKWQQFLHDFCRDSFYIQFNYFHFLNKKITIDQTATIINNFSIKVIWISLNKSISLSINFMIEITSWDNLFTRHISSYYYWRVNTLKHFVSLPKKNKGEQIARPCRWDFCISVFDLRPIVSKLFSKRVCESLYKLGLFYARLLQRLKTYSYSFLIFQQISIHSRWDYFLWLL